ncbi:hypothetical protein AB6A40_008346 [Gnathostoma spinigerum]|uniref:C2H2-type domain-containing protein n=1 Tax=Gnathostoma spinigerum TaxID=75299 RepID=A0ABD6EYF2_9BILA
MYGYPGQSHYGSYNSSFATAPTVYNALQPPQNTQTQPLGANPLGVGSANPTNVYASFSSGSTPSPYTGYAATPNAATAYAPFGQTAAAVAAVQQQQQAAASGVVNGPASGYGHSTRLADSFGSIPSTGATFTSLSDYTTALRPTAAVVSSGGNSYVGVTRIGSTASNPSALSVVSSSTASSAGYDVSLYAAATSNYLQSKATGTTNVWMSAKKPATALDYSGGTTFSSSGSNISGVVTGVVSNTASRGAPSARGTFPPKRYGGLTRAPRDLQQFYCEVCKISCAGSGTYKEHIDGQKHKRKEAMQKEGQVLSKSRVSYRCETCNVTCTGKDTYESHIRGSKHQKTAELMKKLGKPVQLQPTILPPGEKSNATPNSTNGVGNPIATVGGPAVPTKKAELFFPTYSSFIGVGTY